MSATIPATGKNSCGLLLFVAAIYNGWFCRESNKHVGRYLNVPFDSIGGKVDRPDERLQNRI